MERKICQKESNLTYQRSLGFPRIEQKESLNMRSNKEEKTKIQNLCWICNDFG